MRPDPLHERTARQSSNFMRLAATDPSTTSSTCYVDKLQGPAEAAVGSGGSTSRCSLRQTNCNLMLPISGVNYKRPLEGATHARAHTY